MSEDVSQSSTVSFTSSLAGQTDLVPVLLRAIAVLFLAPSAVLKFVDYGGQAAVFADLGIPLPGVTVLAIGVLELVASVLLAGGVRARVGALLTVPVMLVAIALVGPVVSNVAVLLSCVGVVGLGPGRFTLSDPLDYRD